MKTGRLILLLGTAILVVASLSGCLTRSQPQALFTATATEDVVPFAVSFDGTLSYMPEGEIVSYLWTFGDGGSESGPLVEHTYNEDGTYEARLTIIDGRGYSTSTLMTIHALNPLPTAGFSYTPKSNMEGVYFVSCSEPITFDAQDLCSDDGTIVSYEWYFGYRLPDGTAASAAGPVVVHEFLYAGTYNIILTVTDNDGGTTAYIEQLDVKGGPPCNADVTGDVPWTNGGI
ncbi:MAG: PKD domain-containing protein [Candidatus Bipolaricaulia bacterium]